MKRGAASANTVGVMAVMYFSFGVLLGWARGTDDELNTLTAGTATGLLYKSSGMLARQSVSYKSHSPRQLVSHVS